MGVLAVLGIILMFLHISGSAVSSVFILSILGLFYFIFSFALFNGIRLRDAFKSESYQDTNLLKIIGAILLGISISLVIFGIQFKLLFWQGANEQLLIGLLPIGLILIVAAIFYFRDKTEFYSRIFKRITIYGGLGLLLYLTPTSTLVDIYYRDNPDFAELFNKVLEDPENEELRKQLNQMREEISKKNENNH